MIPLRPYQEEGVERVREAMRAGKRRILFVLPTGGGKTVVAAAIVAGALAKGKRVLFCAHRRELIKQTFTKLLRTGLDPAHIGVVMAGVPARARGALFSPLDTIAMLRAQGTTDPQIDAELWSLFAARRPQAPIQVASIDTARGKDLGRFDLLIFDEAHRSLSPSYLALAKEHESAVLLGLTATPYRTDGKGLGALYDDLVPPVLTARQLAEAGFLVAPRMYGAAVESLPDVSRVRIAGADYDEAELAQVTDDPRLIGDFVRHWRERAEGLRTVAFAAGIQHSRHVVEAFLAIGVRAEHIDGETHPAERDAILSRLERGETTVVSNYGVLTEGWDMPIVAVAGLLRATTSRGLAKQMEGRILRPHPDKPFAMLLDHARVILNHDSPLAEEEYSLEAPKKRRTVSVPATKTCPGCFAIIPAGVRTCPQMKIDGTPCEYVFSASEREEPESEEGELVALSDVPMEVKRAAWAELCAARGSYPPGWVRIQYVKRFGVMAPKSWKVPLREDEKDEGKPEVVAKWRDLYRDAWRSGWKIGAAAFRFKEDFGRWPSKALRDEQRAWIEEQERRAADRVVEVRRLRLPAVVWSFGEEACAV